MKTLKRKANVVIGCPSGDTWNHKFGMSLVAMVAQTLGIEKRLGLSEFQLGIENPHGSLLPLSRHRVVEKALKVGATHVLFVDTDQNFPPYTLEVLLAHQEKIVACNIATKCVPSNPTARDFDPNKPGGKMVFCEDHQDGLRRVWRVGTGVMLIDCKVFRRIPEPWFEVRWDEGLKEYRGEDWTFCEKLEMADIPIHVDMGLSKMIGHVGDYEYTHELVIASHDEAQSKIVTA